MSNEQLLREALTLAKDAIEAVMHEMTVGDRFTNAGQGLLDVIGPIRAALAQPAEGGEVDEQSAFEAWFLETQGIKLKRFENGYVIDSARYSWDAWQARARTTPPASQEQAQQPKPQPMTDEVFDLICKAIDKADTITMAGDYMLDSDDCIAVVRVMQVLLSIRHGITSDKEA